MNTTETTERVEFLSLSKCAVKHDLRTSKVLSEQDKETKASIKANGVIQPILVRPVTAANWAACATGKMFEVIAGRKRWQFAKDAGLEKIPALVRTMTDVEAAEFELIENLHREDLSALEEAEGLKRLRDDFKMSIDDIAAKIGRKKTYVYDSLKLCELAAPVKQALGAGKIDRSVAVALGTIPPAIQAVKLNTVIEEDLPFREAVKEIQGSAKEALRNDAAFQKMVAEAKELGRMVLTPRENAAIVWCYNDRDPEYNSPWVGLTSDFSLPNHSRLNVKKSIDASLPLYLGQSPAGLGVWLVKRSELTTHLKKTGQWKEPPKRVEYGSNEWKVQQAQRDSANKAKRKLDDAVNERIFGALAKGIIALKDQRPVLRLLVDDGLALTNAHEIGKRHGWGTSDAALRKRARTMSLGELVCLLVELQISYTSIEDERCDAVFAMFKIDPKAIAEEVRNGEKTTTTRTVAPPKKGKGKRDGKSTSKKTIKIKSKSKKAGAAK